MRLPAWKYPHGGCGIRVHKEATKDAGPGLKIHRGNEKFTKIIWNITIYAFPFRGFEENRKEILLKLSYLIRIGFQMPRPSIIPDLTTLVFSWTSLNWNIVLNIELEMKNGILICLHCSNWWRTWWYWLSKMDVIMRFGQTRKVSFTFLTPPADPLFIYWIMIEVDIFLKIYLSGWLEFTVVVQMSGILNSKWMGSWSRVFFSSWMNIFMKRFLCFDLLNILNGMWKFFRWKYRKKIFICVSYCNQYIFEYSPRFKMLLRKMFYYLSFQIDH